MTSLVAHASAKTLKEKKREEEEKKKKKNRAGLGVGEMEKNRLEWRASASFC